MQIHARTYGTTLMRNIVVYTLKSIYLANVNAVRILSTYFNVGGATKRRGRKKNAVRRYRGKIARLEVNSSFFYIRLRPIYSVVLRQMNRSIVIVRRAAALVMLFLWFMGWRWRGGS